MTTDVADLSGGDRRNADKPDTLTPATLDNTTPVVAAPTRHHDVQERR